VLFVVSFHGFLGVTSGVDNVRSRHVGMVCRLLVLSALVMLCRLTVVMRSVGKMLLHLLVVLSGFFRHGRFLPG
jgi:hypothetical protein